MDDSFEDNNRKKRLTTVNRSTWLLQRVTSVRT